MPAPSQISKKTSVTVLKRTTRSSVCGNRLPTVPTKGKVPTLAGEKGSIPVRNENEDDIANKRKAEKSPKSTKHLKRSALGNITNAVKKSSVTDNKKAVAIKKSAPVPVCSRLLKTQAAKPAPVTAVLAKKPTNVQQISKQNEKVKENTVKRSVVIKKKTIEEKEVIVTFSSTELIDKQKEAPIEVPSVTKPITRQSLQQNDVATTSCSEDSSLYVSALEELNITEDKQLNETIKDPKPPPGVEDFDKANWNDPLQLSHYAFDIFSYLKTREGHFKVTEYMDKQSDLNSVMRSLLVDWMVDVQENFELTHETLYLAVKIVDRYLSKVRVNKDTLQLVGATSLFIASKYDERSPPALEDIVYIGDESYTNQHVIDMEVSILKNLNFDLGFPLSYTFLRRYARCSKSSMQLLTLARFILEYALMEYTTITLSDSKMAAAALHLARKMTKAGSWDTTLEYYSGYRLADFKDIAVVLNDILHKKPKSSLAVVRNKYSHEVFFAVAKTPLIDNSEL